MTDWTEQQLERIGSAGEVEIAPRRPDGSLRPFTTIWAVRVGDRLYVRSWRGPAAAWFRTASQTAEGRLRAGDVEHEVAFENADDVDREAIDTAYLVKYGRSSYVDAMVGDSAAATTLGLIAR